MSKKVIYTVCGFILGAAAGTGITYAVCKAKLESKYQKLEENLHHLYDIKMRRIDEAPVVEDTFDPIESMDDEERKDFYMKKLQDLGYGVFEAEDYESEEVNPDYESNDFFEDDEAPVEESGGIEVLSYNEYIRIDDSQLTCISLNYYGGDNTVTDEDGDIYADWKDAIGTEWVETINKDNPTAYIFNHDRSLLVDIEFKAGTYKELVAGIATDEEG